MTLAISNTATTDATYAINNFLTKIDKKFTSGEGFYCWRDLRYMLYEYEYSLAVQNNLQKVDWSMFTKVEKDKISVEHILPQTPTKWYWRNQFRQYSDDEIKTLSCSLGNLLPLSQSINSSLQNEGFHDKKTTSASGRRGYDNGSHSEIEVSKEAEWDAYRILQRGMKLLKFMETRWQFQFENEAQVLDLLHLNFLLEQRDIPDEIPPEQPSNGLSASVTPVSSHVRMPSDTSSFQLAFWTQFVEYCRSIGRGEDIASRKPYPQNWYEVSIGSKDYTLIFSVVGITKLSICIYAYNINAFKRLESYKNCIESSCGFNLEWYTSREKSRQKRIIYSVDTEIQAEEYWKACFDWLIEHFDGLLTALHTCDMPAKTTAPLASVAGKITEEMVEVTYQISKKVYLEELDRTAGRDEIVRLTGMNQGSASAYISDFLAMMNGEEYHWTLNEYSHQGFADLCHFRALCRKCYSFWVRCGLLPTIFCFSDA